MRMTKKIAELTALAPTVAFPKDDSGWDNFRRTLIEIVRENLVLHGAELEWDSHEQDFYFEVSEAAMVGDFRGSFHKTFTLDPKKPLLGEIERLQAELEDFRNACFRTKPHKD